MAVVGRHVYQRRPGGGGLIHRPDRRPRPRRTSGRSAPSSPDRLHRRASGWSPDLAEVRPVRCRPGTWCPPRWLAGERPVYWRGRAVAPQRHHGAHRGRAHPLGRAGPGRPNAPDA